jgi:hypothetical protein
MQRWKKSKDYKQNTNGESLSPLFIILSRNNKILSFRNLDMEILIYTVTQKFC